MKETLYLFLAVLLLLPLYVRADVIDEPWEWDETIKPEETKAPETIAEKEETETEERNDNKGSDPSGSSEARDISAPVIAVSAAVLVIASALLIHNIVRARKEGKKE